MANARAQNTLTPDARGSFVHLFSPEKKRDGQDGMYTISLLFPKLSQSWMQDLPWLWENISECLAAQFPGGVGMPPVFAQYGVGKPWPVQDGDLPNSLGNFQEAHKGHWVVRIGSRNFDANINLIKLNDQGMSVPVTQAECFSGCYFKAQVNAYFYNTEGSIGVAIGMNNVMFVRTGESLGGRGTDAATAFGVPVGAATAAGAFQPGAAPAPVAAPAAPVAPAASVAAPGIPGAPAVPAAPQAGSPPPVGAAPVVPQPVAPPPAAPGAPLDFMVY